MRISEDGKTFIGIDSLNMIEITQYIGQDARHKSKFLDIVGVIMEGLHSRGVFKREKISAEVTNIWAMRFFVGQENDRIYCQEKSANGQKIIILGILLLHKESKENTQREINEIEKLSKYDYEFEG